MDNYILGGWTKQEDKRREELLKKDYTYADVSNILKKEFGLREYSADSVRSRSRRTNSTINEIEIEKVSIEQDNVLSLSERLSLFNKFIKRDPRQFCNYDMAEDKCDKTIVLSDIHVPFAEYGMVDAIIEKESGEDVKCVIGGDFLDCYSLSTFRKEQEIPLVEELQDAAILVDKLSNAFGSVEFIIGNHEERFKKFLLDHLPTELMFLIETNLIKYIVEGYNNITVSDNFFIQVGSAIIGHPAIYSSIALRSALNAKNWYSNFYREINLSPFNLIVHTHTHKAGECYVDELGRMVKIIENGCLCNTLDYTLKGRSGGSPAIRGYTKLYFDDEGTAILPESRFILTE